MLLKKLNMNPGIFLNNTQINSFHLQIAHLLL